MLVNSVPICLWPQPIPTLAAMAGARKKYKSDLKGEARADWQRLKAKWDEFEAQDPKTRTQEWLAEQCGWKTQGAANQYLNGYIRLNLTALVRFAKVMGFDPKEVSPSLAADLEFLTTPGAQRELPLEAAEAADLVAKHHQHAPSLLGALKSMVQLIEKERAHGAEAATDTTVEHKMPVTKQLRLARDTLTRAVKEPPPRDLFSKKNPL